MLRALDFTQQDPTSSLQHIMFLGFLTPRGLGLKPPPPPSCSQYGHPYLVRFSTLKSSSQYGHPNGTWAWASKKRYLYVQVPNTVLNMGTVSGPWHVYFSSRNATQHEQFYFFLIHVAAVQLSSSKEFTYQSVQTYNRVNQTIEMV